MSDKIRPRPELRDPVNPDTPPLVAPDIPDVVDVVKKSEKDVVTDVIKKKE